MLALLLLLSAIALGLLSGQEPMRVGTYFVDGLLGWQTLQLLGVVTLIEMLSVLLEHTGAMERSLSSLRRVFSDVRVLVALVPTILGPLPVPGGAMLSAPMVGKYGDELGMAADEKASVNLFFRHIWDLVSPFKPTVIVASAVLNIPIFTLIGWQLPVSVAAFLFGYWYLVARRAVPVTVVAAPAVKPSTGHPSLWIDSAPLVMSLLLALLTGVDYVFAVAVGLVFGIVTQKASLATVRMMVVKGIDREMLLTLASVMIFKTVVEGTDSMRGVTDALTGFGVPLWALVFILPMVIGHAVGMEMPAVALVFPLVLGLLPEGTPILPYAIVMLLSNAAGSILSPVHVCVVVGNSYFGSKWARVVRLNLAPMAFRLSVGMALAWAIATYLPS